MENLGKNEQRRMKAHIADLERQLDQAQANAYNHRSPVHTICNENLKEALAAALEQMTRADAAEAELDQLALLDEKQCSNVYSELIDLLHIHAKGSVIEAVTDLQAKLADAGDGSCDHCGCVPAIVMPTSLCDECRDGVKRAEIAEAKLAALDWTPITPESLPQTGEKVLIVWSGTVPTVAYHRTGIGFACCEGYQWEPAGIDDSDPIPDDEVTHWMPLPNPPAKGAADGKS